MDDDYDDFPEADVEDELEIERELYGGAEDYESEEDKDEQTAPQVAVQQPRVAVSASVTGNAAAHALNEAGRFSGKSRSRIFDDSENEGQIDEPEKNIDERQKKPGDSWRKRESDSVTSAKLTRTKRTRDTANGSNGSIIVALSHHSSLSGKLLKTDSNFCPTEIRSKFSLVTQTRLRTRRVDAQAFGAFDRPSNVRNYEFLDTFRYTSSHEQPVV